MHTADFKSTSKEVSSVSATFILDTDTSIVGLGAVLSQEGEHGEQVIANFSRSLSRPERNYCVSQLELLDVIRGIHHFRTYLKIRQFLLHTDHSSPYWVLNSRVLAGQLAQWPETLQDYNFESRQRAGRFHTKTKVFHLQKPCFTSQNGLLYLR